MSNRLAEETSPYLKQHAGNPVDWYPWSEAAFQRARDEDKPVLLSIGYSACHWCHVMAHESFEDEATADVMNELFVNIKVDREERPDIDRIYQTAQQLLTQRGGGWPLTMFLSAEDQRPFFGGTYFPKDARYGMPAFSDVLQSVAKYYAEQRKEVRNQGDRLVDVLARLDPPPADDAAPLTRAPIDALPKAISQVFDREYGGTGTQPKFPHPGTISALLRHWRSTSGADEPDLDALFMATLTLKRMADGGLYDHLGGGFCRYSVDRYWQIPHFEKMLYDNGPLLAVYTEAWLATGDEAFRVTANGVADWLLEDMRAENGGFYSTRDADSEGEEGRYYVWDRDTVRELVDERDFALVSARFGLDQPANFEGHWHLTVRREIDEIAEAAGRAASDVASAIDRARATLLEKRAERVPPARDEKQIASWNALAIRGLAIAGRGLVRDDLIDAAGAGLDFVRECLFADGRLKSVFTDGAARFAGYLDDYAFLLDACLELLQSRWSTSHLYFAIELADALLLHFEDRDHGGFYFTAHDAESLIHRSKPFADDALPSGNGVAAFALQRLGFLLGEPRYLDSAERALRAAWTALDDVPHGHVSLLPALDEYLDHPEIVVIRGGPEACEWRHEVTRLYAPRRLVFSIAADEKDLPGALQERSAKPGATVAYRCVGTHCDLPVESLRALIAVSG